MDTSIRWESERDLSQRPVELGWPVVQWRRPIARGPATRSSVFPTRGVRPQIDSISTAQPRLGGAATIEILPQTQITSVVLMGVQTTTHWVEAGIPRRVVLPVMQQASTVTVTLPGNPNVLPLGHYTLFAMVDDIPSVARATPKSMIFG